MRADEKHALFVCRSNTAATAAIMTHRGQMAGGGKSAFRLVLTLRYFKVYLFVVKNSNPHRTGGLYSVILSRLSNAM